RISDLDECGREQPGQDIVAVPKRKKLRGCSIELSQNFVAYLCWSPSGFEHAGVMFNEPGMRPKDHLASEKVVDPIPRVGLARRPLFTKTFQGDCNGHITVFKVLHQSVHSGTLAGHTDKE